MFTSDNWLQGLRIPIKGVSDGIADGDQTRDINILYHTFYNGVNELFGQSVGSSQITIIDRASDVLCHATGDPHYITMDQTTSAA